MLNRVMLTNDDGIDAPGMRVMEEIAAQIATEVWVVAPEHDQSGQSHAISLHHPLRIFERGPRRFGVTGTPGDCAAMGLCHIMTDTPPDLVLSGVNRGLNLGMETVFSGTVGGAMTAMMLGVPALALSQAFTRRDAVPWDTARSLAPEVIRKLLAIGWGKQAVLNINFPPLPAAEVGPVTLARQGEGMVAGMHVETRVDPRGMTYHWLNFMRGDRQQGPESDYSAMRAGKIVVTPLRYDRTDDEAYAGLTPHLPRFEG
ncbi:MAG TPA: 5'/3'-nucleotidase SurE [Rhodopila sp.]|uniref:5'/3'-nucleotidase SurE n=1 Tax=Rhodopila sp. TaxID=2480087 RepID=UPI002C548950|nr:5'/3'-nucleotidase SurE [Rhodopila sp.]HVY15113.1 5'/3'-nucleotidase SurE [Rhodopila sp.]